MLNENHIPTLLLLHPHHSNALHALLSVPFSHKIIHSRDIWPGHMNKSWLQYIVPTWCHNKNVWPTRWLTFYSIAIVYSFNLTDQVSCSQTVRGRQWGFNCTGAFRFTVNLMHANKIGHIVGQNNCVSVMRELSIAVEKKDNWKY